MRTMKMLLAALSMTGCMTAASGPGPAAGGGTLPPPAPNGEVLLSRAQCEQAVDHVLNYPTIGMTQEDLGMLDKMKQNRATFVTQCTQNATQADFDCLMRTQSMADLDSCPPPRHGQQPPPPPQQQPPQPQPQPPPSEPPGQPVSPY